MKRLILLLVLSGCRVPPTVIAPIDIYVEGKSGAIAPQPIPYVEEPKDITWSIDLFAPIILSEPKSWSFSSEELPILSAVEDMNGNKIPRVKVLIQIPELTCYVERSRGVVGPDMMRVECSIADNGIDSGYITAVVACGKTTKDSVEIERNGVNVHAVCEVKN